MCTSGVQSINTKYKMYALEIRLTLGPVCLQLLPHFTAFYGHSPQLSGFPEFFNNSDNVHKRLIVLCTGAFFNTSSNLFWFFKGRGNRVPIYCDSWHNVDILIVVTMLNVDAWRRSSVGWQIKSCWNQTKSCCNPQATFVFLPPFRGKIPNLNTKYQKTHIASIR